MDRCVDGAGQQMTEGHWLMCCYGSVDVCCESECPCVCDAQPVQTHMLGWGWEPQLCPAELHQCGLWQRMPPNVELGPLLWVSLAQSSPSLMG